GVTAGVPLDLPTVHDATVRACDLLPVERSGRPVERRVSHVDVVAHTLLTGDVTVARVRVPDLDVLRSHAGDRIGVLNLRATRRHSPLLVAEHLVVLPVDRRAL